MVDGGDRERVRLRRGLVGDGLRLRRVLVWGATGEIPGGPVYVAVCRAPVDRRSFDDLALSRELPTASDLRRSRLECVDVVRVRVGYGSSVIVLISTMTGFSCCGTMTIRDVVCVEVGANCVGLVVAAVA